MGAAEDRARIETAAQANQNRVNVIAASGINLSVDVMHQIQIIALVRVLWADGWDNESYRTWEELVQTQLSEWLDGAEAEIRKQRLVQGVRLNSGGPNGTLG
jgi:hypothetical protein